MGVYAMLWMKLLAPPPCKKLTMMMMTAKNLKLCLYLIVLVLYAMQCSSGGGHDGLDICCYLPFFSGKRTNKQMNK